MHRWIVPSTLLAIVSLALAGCSSQPESASSSAGTSTTATQADGQIVAYRNGEGKLLCPVMNVVIKSEADAKGHQDYEGTRYYFCCGICPGKFAANPAKYAKK